MTIYRVRLVYSETGASSFNGWLNVWLTNMAPWSERPNEVPAQSPDPGPHYRGDLTFEWSHDKSIILDQLDGYLSAYSGWYRLGYHVCDHDETDRGGCQWETQRDGGPIPEWVQSFQGQ